MKVLKQISILLIVTLITVTAMAQEKKLRRADESFEAEEYYKAMEEYTAILKKIKILLVKDQKEIGIRKAIHRVFPH